MRSIRMLGLAVGLLALSGAVIADEKEDKKVMKDLEGTYLIIGVEAKGFKLTEKELKEFSKDDKERTLVIKDGQLQSPGKEKDKPATFKIDASKKPAQIDITSDKDGKKEVSYGIFKFEDGVLTICATEKGEEKDRPKEFKVGDTTLMLTLKKQAAK